MTPMVWREMGSTMGDAAHTNRVRASAKCSWPLTTAPPLGGPISLHSPPGTGTTVMIKLPLAE
jgi:hypothetical protein